jgi:hypothetical protein
MKQKLEKFLELTATVELLLKVEPVNNIRTEVYVADVYAFGSFTIIVEEGEDLDVVFHARDRPIYRVAELIDQSLLVDTVACITSLVELCPDGADQYKPEVEPECCADECCEEEPCVREDDQCCQGMNCCK